MRVHLRKLDETFESVESALLAVTQEISLIHGRLDILESRSSAQSEQEEVLMRRQISLEHRESVLEEKVQELQLASSGEDFIYGLLYLLYGVTCYLSQNCNKSNLC